MSDSDLNILPNASVGQIFRLRQNTLSMNLETFNADGIFRVVQIALKLIAFETFLLLLRLGKLMKF